MKPSICIVAIGALAVLLLPGCTSTHGHPGNVTAHAVPRLVVITSCNQCEIPDEMPDLIRKSYDAAAAKAGATMSPTQRSTLTIWRFSRRSAGFLILAGPLALAMTDDIEGVLAVDGRSMPVEYRSRTPIPFFRTALAAGSLGEEAFRLVNE